MKLSAWMSNLKGKFRISVFRTDKGQTVNGTVSINALFKGTVQDLCVFRTSGGRQ